MANPNLEILQKVVFRLGNLADDFVFLGGCITWLLISDEAAAAIRPTKDVDGIIEAYTYTQYKDFEIHLERSGFQRVIDGPICRWKIDGLLLDVMPIEGGFLGFNSKWFVQAVKTSERLAISSVVKIRAVIPAYFLATKLEAFYDRGKNDFLESRDLEDIITVINGREELYDEVQNSESDVRTFICKSLSNLLTNPAFIQSIPGHLMPDTERAGLVIERIKKISEIEL